MILSEAELQELLAARPAPTVTDEKINALIKQATVYQHQHLTIMVLELVNGFFVVGKSAPAAAENFNQKVGVHYAFLDARRQIWQVEGYLLRQKLFEDGTNGAAAG